jgi:hypothetical protein
MDASLPTYEIYMRELVRKLFGKSYQVPPGGYEKMNVVFKEAGGSWYDVIQGDMTSVEKLKDTVKAAKKKGLIREAGK